MAIIHMLVLLLPMFLFMGLGMNIFVAMGVTSLISLVVFDLPLMIMAKSYISGIDHYTLLALPFYFLAGDLMNMGGITKRLLSFSMALVGHLRGGLAHVNIISSMIFAGVSGSAAADVAAIGSVLIPAMKKEGYSPAFSAAVTSASATIGPVIPPSIAMVIYGVLAQVSIGRLFLAGVIPGLLMGTYLLVVSFLISRKRGYPARERASLKQVFRSAVDAGAALVMPVIIVGGIVSGIATPTESGAVAVAYGLLLGMFFFREIKVRELPRIFGQTMVNTGALLIIIATTGLFGWIIATSGLPDLMVHSVTSVSSNKWVILGLCNILLLILGCFLEGPVLLMIIVPILVPIAESVGIDLVHFGIVMVINVLIGSVTPPFGMGMFITASMASARITSVIREMVPFLVALLLVLALVTYWPAMVLWLPNLLML